MLFRKKNEEPMAEPVKQEKVEQVQAAVLGVTDTFQLVGEAQDDLIVVGKLQGTISTGDAVYITTVGDENAPVSLTTVLAMETGPNTKVETATDCRVALCLEKGNTLGIKKGCVVHTRTASVAQVRSAYTNALGDLYVGGKELDLTEEELDSLSLVDGTEIWRLFQYYKSQVKPDQTKEEQEASQKKVERLAESLKKKLFEQESMYTIFSKQTGEPFMLARITKLQDERFNCSPPDILLFTKSEMPFLKQNFPEEEYDYQVVENAKDKKGIYNFISQAVYLNGACGVALNGMAVSIDKSRLVSEPDFGDIPNIQVPVMNPDLERWLLLLGQIGQPENAEQETICNIYLSFLRRELPKAKFLVPTQHEGEIPAPDASGKTTVKKGVKIKFPVLPAKTEGRQAARLYTDWKRLNAGMGDGYEGWIQTAEDMIDGFDLAINVTQYQSAGIYVSKEMFDEMKQLQ